MSRNVCQWEAMNSVSYRFSFESAPNSANPPATLPPLAPSPPLPPLARREFDFSELDRLLAVTDQAIRRAQDILGTHQSAPPTAGLTNCESDSLRRDPMK